MDNFTFQEEIEWKKKINYLLEKQRERNIINEKNKINKKNKNNKWSKKYKCVCGSIIRNDFKLRHERTQKHQKWFNNPEQNLIFVY